MPPALFIDLGIVVGLVGLLGGLVYYLYQLRTDFYEACRKTDNLKLFADCPLGLPVGSVRSTLALVIILFAVGYVGAAGISDVPQFLTAIVSTVLGFYFGSRSSGDSQRKLTSMIDTMSSSSAPKTEEGSPPAAPSSPSSAPSAEAASGRRETAHELLARLRDGLSLTEVARSALPPPLRRQFASLVQGLQNGIDTVQGLLSANSVDDALQQAKALLDRFQKENPVRTITERALGTFGAVLGSTVAPLPLIGSIVRVATTVKTQVYDRWKRRILHLTFKPSDLPIERVDANTGFTLLVDTPIMKTAFRKELEANDRPFLEDTAEELLATGDLDSLWSTYSDRFDSRRQFEEGVAALRRTAADLSLRAEIDDAVFDEVGGYDQTVAAIDELHTDEAARGDLDAIVTMIESLRTADDVSLSSLQQLVETVRTDLGSNDSSH